MMNKAGSHRIAAFTIFEVTVVMAIMGILITMITYSMNRFQDQLKVTADVQEELNNWYHVRGTLWHDCILADSIVVEPGQMAVYQSADSSVYTIEDEQLFRLHKGVKTDLKIGAQELFSRDKNGWEEIVLRFDWKPEPLEWTFLNRPDVAGSINHYFKQKNG